MTTNQLLLTTWKWNPALLLLCAAAVAAYFFAFGQRSRPIYFASALATFLVALISPLGTLADGYLFSAHMAQHILLVLIVPAFLLLSLPYSFSFAQPLRIFTRPLIGWFAGVGAMWLWHAPTLCNAATTFKTISAIQTISLLIMGSLFWWQVLAPRQAERLSPGAAIAYLFTACTACSVLGIIVTLAPVSVCPIYLHPSDRLGLLENFRNCGLTTDRDQQIGGLLMWVPMCLVYASAILAQFSRWQSGCAPHPEKHNA